MSAERGRRYWLTRAGVAVVSVLVALGLLELLLGRHTADDAGAAFFAEAPEDVDVPYVLAPDTEVRFEGHYVKIPATTVRISSQGLRSDVEYAIPKPAGVTRIIGLGDSFVFGSGVEAAQTFLSRWQAALSAVEVLNLGVPGYTSTHAVELLAKRGLQFQPVQDGLKGPLQLLTLAQQGLSDAK